MSRGSVRVFRSACGDVQLLRHRLSTRERWCVRYGLAGSTGRVALAHSAPKYHRIIGESERWTDRGFCSACAPRFSHGARLYLSISRSSLEVWTIHPGTVPQLIPGERSGLASARPQSKAARHRTSSAARRLEVHSIPAVVVRAALGQFRMSFGFSARL